MALGLYSSVLPSNIPRDGLLSSSERLFQETAIREWVGGKAERGVVGMPTEQVPSWTTKCDPIGEFRGNMVHKVLHLSDAGADLFFFNSYQSLGNKDH